MKALLIIDMQAGGLKLDNFSLDISIIIDRINKLAVIMRNSGHKIVFIQHDGSNEDSFIPGTPDWEIISGLTVKPDDITISKTSNDPFYESDLQNKLDGFGIKELIITGWATDFCVDSAIRSALARNFSLVVVKDGHIVADRPHLKAEKVIEHHNWVWSGMIPTKGTVRVVAFKDLMTEFDYQ